MLAARSPQRLVPPFSPLFLVGRVPKPRKVVFQFVGSAPLWVLFADRGDRIGAIRPLRRPGLPEATHGRWPGEPLPRHPGCRGGIELVSFALVGLFVSSVSDFGRFLGLDHISQEQVRTFFGPSTRSEVSLKPPV